MIRINLLPYSESEAAVSRRREILLAGGLLTIVLVAVFSAHVFQTARLNAINSVLTSTENEMVLIRRQNQDIQKLEQQKKELEGKIWIVNLLTSPTRRAASVHILDDLSDSAPQMLWLTEFTENNGAAKINGKAVDNQTIAAFARKLSNSLYFKRVEIRETVQEKPLPNLRPQTVGGRNPALDTPPVPVTRFLVEASIDYLPDIPPPQESAPKTHDSKEGKETFEKER